MQGYSEAFAAVYNRRWAGFADTLAPRLLALYAGTENGRARQPVLDLCCGTGQLAGHFLQNGYHVVGIDLSPGMLRYAGENNADAVAAGRAVFLQANAADFLLERPVGMVVSTYDALNHLPDFAALNSCFGCVARSLLPGGLFVFDLNTRLGLQRWAAINVIDEPDLMLVNRGVYPADEGRAYTQITGFARLENGLFQRFAETVYNTVFDLTAVRASLLDAGFRQAYCAAPSDLTARVDEPEALGRVFFIARHA